MNALRCLIAATLAAPFTLAAGAAGATDWDVVKEESVLGFTFTQGDEAVEGRFGEWDAEITFDTDDLDNARARVTIAIDSVDTGRRRRNRTAQGKDWLGADAHPQAVFETTAFSQTGEGTYEAEATLTLKGESQPITLPFTLLFDGNRVTMEGEAALDRTVFGVGTGDRVGTEVTVQVDLTAVKTE